MEIKMSELKGIKETLELLEGVKVLVLESKKVLSDGKVSLSDLPVLLGLLQKFSVLNAAVQGVEDVIAEAKDLSSDEANIVVSKVLEIVAAVKAA